MLRLLTFGGLRVVREDGTSTELTNQRRRLAVLAAAAGAAPAGVAREKLLFLLWPDSEADKGRHALNQIVYNLRRELGTSPLDGVAELTLLPDVITADLVEFRAAVARGDHAAAIALYTGPFLDGFFVPGAVEFERWAEEERARTSRQAIVSLDALATASMHEPVEHVRWTARLLELDPLSARRAVAHMRALERSGDRDAAVACGRRHEVLVKADGDAVDAAVSAEIERLRALPTLVGLPTAPGSPSSMPSASLDPDMESDRVARTPALDAGPVSDSTPEPGIAPHRRNDAVGTDAPARRGTHWRRLVAIASLTVAGGAAILWTRSRPPALPLGVGDQMLLADVQMPASDTASARAMALALESALQQSARVHLLSPNTIRDVFQRMKRSRADLSMSDSTALEVAEREGVRYVISLTVTPTGATRRLTLRVIDPRSRNLVRSYAVGAATDAMLPAIDELTAMVRRDLGDTPGEIAAALPLPRATTSSLEALRLLASGRDAINRKLHNDALALFNSAIALDSGFAAAWAGLAEVHFTVYNAPAGTAAMTRALALADRLPPRERMLIEAAAERGRGDWFRAASLHRAYLIRYPNDYDVWELLAFDLIKGKVPAEAIVAYDTVRAHRRLSAAALMNIGQSNILLERYQAAHDAFAEAVHLDTLFISHDVENERIGTTFMRLGFNDSARTVFSIMLTRDANDQGDGHRMLAYVDLAEGRYARAVEHLKAAIELTQEQDGGGIDEIRDRAMLATALIDLGRTAEAGAQLREAAKVGLTDPYPPVLLLWTGKPAARLGDTSLARHLLDSARARTRGTDRGQVAVTTGLEAELLVAQGRVRDGIATAERAVATDTVAYLVETLAYALERAGRLNDARAQQAILARGRLKQMGKEAQQMALFAPLAIARIDAQLGRTEEARRAVGQFMERWPTADANLPMITQLRARIEMQGRAAASGPSPR